MFENAGGRIKNLVDKFCKIALWTTWIASGITFIVLVADEWTAYLCWIPLVAALVLTVTIWLGGLFLYAFGEMAENITKIKDDTTYIRWNLKYDDPAKKYSNPPKAETKTRPSSVPIQKPQEAKASTTQKPQETTIKKPQETIQATYAVAEPAKNTSPAGKILLRSSDFIDEKHFACPKCKTVQPSGRNTCKSCGITFVRQ